MYRQQLVTLVALVGAVVLAALGEVDGDAVLAFIAGSVLPQPWPPRP